MDRAFVGAECPARQFAAFAVWQGCVWPYGPAHRRLPSLRFTPRTFLNPHMLTLKAALRGSAPATLPQTSLWQNLNRTQWIRIHCSHPPRHKLGVDPVRRSSSHLRSLVLASVRQPKTNACPDPYYQHWGCQILCHRAQRGPGWHTLASRRYGAVLTAHKTKVGAR